MNGRYLVVYDYGQGGIWAYVNAASPEEIEQRFPELRVIDEPPAWMTEEYRARLEQTTCDINEAEVGLLADILAQRESR